MQGRFNLEALVGRPSLSDLLFQAMIAAGQEAGRQAAEAELQAAEADELDDAQEELTNEPIGYNLVSRHETLDIALYAQESGSTMLLLVEGNVIQFPDESPDVTFSRFSALSEYESVYAVIDAAYPDGDEDEVGEVVWAGESHGLENESNFMGAYRKGLDGVVRLWTIYDLNVTREALNAEQFTAWVKGLQESTIAVAFTNNKEMLPNEL
jgi:hypothetical protein